MRRRRGDSLACPTARAGARAVAGVAGAPCGRARGGVRGVCGGVAAGARETEYHKIPSVHILAALREADSRSEPSLFFSRYDPIRPSIFTHQSRSSSLLKCPLLAHGRGAHCGQGMSCQSPLPALPHRIGAGSVGAAVPPCRATQPPAAVQPGAEFGVRSSPASSGGSGHGGQSSSRHTAPPPLTSVTPSSSSHAVSTASLTSQKLVSYRLSFPHAHSS